MRSRSTAALFLLLPILVLGGCNFSAGGTSASEPAAYASPEHTREAVPPAAEAAATDRPAGGTPSASPDPAASAKLCNAAALLADVTVPDGWQVGPSEHFTKTWLVQNTGSCTWTAGYFIVFDGGERMGAPDARQLSLGVVPPGGMVEASLDLIAPGSAGSYLGMFKLRASDGSVFGIGPEAGEPLRVDIRVVLGEPKLTTYQVGSQTVVAPGETGEVTAECPAGTVATGGGFDGGKTLSAHFMGLAGNGWRVAALNRSDTAQALSAYAVCLAAGGGVSVSPAAADKSIYARTAGQVNVTCPDGSVVSGIGYAVDPTGMIVTGTDRMGIVARIFATNTSDSMQTVRGQPACLTPFTRVSYLPIRVERQVPGRTVTALEAACPPSTFLTGGGFNFFSKEMTVVGLSKKPGTDTWTVTAENRSAAPQWLMSLAICMNFSMM